MRCPNPWPLLTLVLVTACGTTEGGGTDAGDDDDDDVIADAGTSDSKPDEPDASLVPACEGEGTACSAEGANGLCLGGSCMLCAGAADDDACQSAYGADHICIGGACEIGECHGPGGCGGLPCVENQCTAGCDNDSDCAQGQVCNVGTGACVDNGQCGGQSAGEACNVNPDDMCCNASGGGGLVCKAVECCSDAQCASDENCVAGACVDDGSGGGTLCAAPTGQTVHVDPNHTGSSTGSAACPYKRLAPAFNYIRDNDLNTETAQAFVVVHSKVDVTSEGADAFPLTIPAYTTLRGVLEEDRPVVEVPTDTTAFEVPYNGSRVRHLQLRQVTDGTSGSGLKVSGGNLDHPVEIYEVYIHGFNNGVKVIDGGRAEIKYDTRLEQNEHGLYVDGGRAYVTVNEGEVESRFNENTIGIYVGGANTSFLKLNGAFDAEGDRLIRVSQNLEYGLRFQSTEPDSEVWATAFNNNGKSGALVYQGSVLKVRNSAFLENGDNGFRAIPNGTVHDLSMINLGNLPDGAGGNYFADNAHAGLCATETGDNTSSWITAEGNTFSGVACTAPGTISWSSSCLDGPVDVGFPYNNSFDSVDTSNCISVPQ